MTGVSKDAITRLLVSAGNAAVIIRTRHFANLKCRRIQCDEIWQFVYAKDKNVPDDKRGQFGFGSVWTWVAMDADTKLVPAFTVGNRDALTAKMFIQDLAERLSNRVQMTTDGLKIYLSAIEDAFGCEIDYAMLIKIYESSQEETRYSPAQCISAEPSAHNGEP